MKSQKGNAAIALVIVLFIISVGVTFWKRDKNQTTPPAVSIVITPSPTLTPTITPTPTIEIDPKTGWKIYRNNKFNFEFKYPMEFNLSKEYFGSSGGVDLEILNKNHEFVMQIQVHPVFGNYGSPPHAKSIQTKIGDNYWVYVPSYNFCDAGSCDLKTLPEYRIKVSSYNFSIRSTLNNKELASEKLTHIFSTFKFTPD